MTGTDTTGADTYQGATAESIRHHYDVSNDFYALWLDSSLTYTCALWDFDDPGDTLERAQRRKLDHLIEGRGPPARAGCSTWAAAGAA
ncbi:class I SAM-dependent methyltransferase [Streptomyces sp. M19]